MMNARHFFIDSPLSAGASSDDEEESVNIFPVVSPSNRKRSDEVATPAGAAAVGDWSAVTAGDNDEETMTARESETAPPSPISTTSRYIS